ncbi:MAG: peptide/nickel transport system substrate-binding protein [Thermomicrobiales bacterium]|nr:peptide/nickel transport system substrate-binding protein [Thermomicrobiales bacterium]
MSVHERGLTRRHLLQATVAGAGGLALAATMGKRDGGTLAQDAQAGGSLIVTISKNDINGFATWQDSTAQESAVWSVVFDTLVEYDESYNVTGGLLESWETADAITWTFKVRQGVTWHDGQPLVAKHVTDYFTAVQDPASGAVSNVTGAIKGATFEAVDDQTVRLVLAAPNAALLDNFSSQWLARTADFDNAKPIGTGPFSFVEWNRNQHVKFVKNASYWKAGLPYLDDITMRMVPDQDQAINLLTTGEVHAIASVNFPRVAELSSNPAIQMLEVPEQYRLAYHYLLTKTDTAPWDNPKVRQALNHAVDREALLAATLGYGEIRSNPVSPGSWAFNPEAPSYNTRNLDAAKALMVEAGFTEGETAFKTTLKYWKEWAQMPQIAQIVQSNLAEIGIEVELQLLEIGQWVEAVAGQLDYKMALTALVPRWDPSDQIGNAYTSDDGEALLWSNPDFEAAYAEGAASADIEQRKPAYFRCQEIALTECPGTVLNGAPIFAAASTKVEGIIQYNRGYQRYHQASLKS